MKNAIRNIRLEKLVEREKELNCLYDVEKILGNKQASTEKVFKELVHVIPPGFQYSTVCESRITFEDKEYKTEDFEETEWMLSSAIVVDEHVAGKIDVAYTQVIRLHKGEAFLPEEQRLLNTIALSVGRYVFRRKLKSTMDYLKSTREDKKVRIDEKLILTPESDEHWKWRHEIVQKIAACVPVDKFGIRGLYLIGSTKNANAGPGSDIDLIAHVDGTDHQKEKLSLWMEGWGLCLTEMNFMKSGYRCSGSLIDLHIITDEDIKNKDSFASMLTAVTDRARPLRLNV